MNTKTILLGAAAMLLCGQAAVAHTVRFGYAPADVTETQTSAAGSGSNNYTEAAIRLSPAESPAFAALKGSKITGIRCYLRTDYRNAVGKNHSQIRYYQGSTSTPLVQDKVNFTQGWNEFTFSEPLTITDQDVYLGYQVFETNGSPYPAVCFKGASVPGAANINLARGGFQTYTDRGTLFIEAIIETDTPAQPAAVAMLSDCPLVVAPLTPFTASVYVRNLSDQPISDLTVTVTDRRGDVTDRLNITLTEPIPAFDGRLLTDRDVTLGAELGSDVPVTITVTAINGTETTLTHPVQQTFFVNRDAFTRVPLIEEFTSMYCINCPLMFYYLEEAMHNYPHPYVYLSRHAGFMDDDFTEPTAKALETHFGVNSNPAVMYDRTILPGENKIVLGAYNEPLSDGYTECIDKARHIPALASVNVQADPAAGTVTVSGRASVGTQTTDGRLYISAYLVEEGIPTTEFPQRGIDYDFEDYKSDPRTPADLFTSYRHNGVIRASLTQGDMGDKLEIDPDGNYSVTYTMPDTLPEWVPANLHYVALLHRNTPGTNVEQIADNIVLNAGDSRPFVKTGISAPAATSSEATPLQIAVIGHRIHVITPVRHYTVTNTAGRTMPRDATLTPGIYIVRATLPDGTTATAKTLLR